jgi:hypothetical protein
VGDVSGRTSRSRPGIRALAALATAFAILRLPSLLEPTWYSDEGTYADIGFGLLHGGRLYSTVWDNKPPGIYWLAAAVVGGGGANAFAFHLVLALVVAAGAIGVWVVAERLGEWTVAVLATCLFVVVTAVPTLDGGLFNAEIIGAVLCVWAMVMMIPRGEWSTRPLVAGALVGVACLFKTVFVFDVVAVALVPLWLARATGAPVRWRATLLVVAGAALAAACAAVIVALTGSLGGLVDVLLHQDVGYVQRTSGAGGLAFGQRTGLFTVATLALVVRVVLPLIAGVGAGWFLSARCRSGAAVVAGWVACDVSGALVSARGFPHYSQQVEGSLAIGAALLVVIVWRRGLLGRVVGVAAVVALWPLLVAIAYVPGAELALMQGDRLPPLARDTFPVRRLGSYYRVTFDRAFRGAGSGSYGDLFPVDMQRNSAAIALVREHSAPGQAVFVWGPMHWIYARSGRVPAARYVSLASAYAADPSSESRLVRELTANPPAVLVVDQPLPAQVTALVQARGYHLVAGASGLTAWVAASPGGG